MKRFMRFLPVMIVFLMMSAVVSSCGDDDDEKVEIKDLKFDEASEKLVRDGIDFSAGRNEANLRFQNNVSNRPNVTVTYPSGGEKDWLRAPWRPISETEMTISITCDENNTSMSRTGTVVINVQGYKSVRINVTQSGR